MLIAEVIKAIESIAPPHLQAGWDNTGLQTGDRSATCTGRSEEHTSELQSPA